MNKTEMENKIKAMEEELSRLKEELNKKLNKEEKGYFKPREHEEYYCVNDTSGIIEEYEWCDMNCDNICYEKKKRNKTKEEAEKVLFEQNLFRKIKRFRDVYDKENIDWNNHDERKYYIHYDYQKEEIKVNWLYTFRDALEIYFNSKEVTERCLEEFREDLEKYFAGNY